MEKQLYKTTVLKAEHTVLPPFFGQFLSVFVNFLFSFSLFLQIPQYRSCRRHRLFLSDIGRRPVHKDLSELLLRLNLYQIVLFLFFVLRPDLSQPAVILFLRCSVQLVLRGLPDRSDKTDEPFSFLRALCFG